MRRIKVTTLDRPYLMISKGHTFVITSLEAQRLIDAMPKVEVIARGHVRVSDPKAYYTAVADIIPATHGGQSFSVRFVGR